MKFVPPFVPPTQNRYPWSTSAGWVRLLVRSGACRWRPAGIAEPDAPDQAGRTAAVTGPCICTAVAVLKPTKPTKPTKAGAWPGGTGRFSGCSCPSLGWRSGRNRPVHLHGSGRFETHQNPPNPPRPAPGQVGRAVFPGALARRWGGDQAGIGPCVCTAVAVLKPTRTHQTHQSGCLPGAPGGFSGCPALTNPARANGNDGDVTPGAARETKKPPGLRQVVFFVGP